MTEQDSMDKQQLESRLSDGELYEGELPPDTVQSVSDVHDTPKLQGASNVRGAYTATVSGSDALDTRRGGYQHGDQHWSARDEGAGSLGADHERLRSSQSPSPGPSRTARSHSRSRSRSPVFRSSPSPDWRRHQHSRARYTDSPELRRPHSRQQRRGSPVYVYDNPQAPGGRSNSSSRGPEATSMTLFVGDLPWQASSQDLYAVFEALAPPGGITEARVMQGKSYGFVTFKDSAVAESVVVEAGERGTGPFVFMRGRKLRVGRAPGSLHQARRSSNGVLLQDMHAPSPTELQTRHAAGQLILGASTILQAAEAGEAVWGAYGTPNRSPRPRSLTPGNASGGQRSRTPGKASGDAYRPYHSPAQVAAAVASGSMQQQPAVQHQQVLSYDDL